MFSFLIKNRKGLTLIELLVVLVLLSFGVLALANMFKVTYRAFQKSEERSIKQEAVKTVAELLQRGSVGVSAAQTADIFNDVSVVPTVDAVDRSYSYLFAIPHYCCSVCEESLDNSTDTCSNACEEATSKKDGYYICVQDKGKNGNSARMLSDVPIYIEITSYTVDENETKTSTVSDDTTYPGVVVELSALESDYDYNSGVPKSDDKYYSLDVAYHFPNMVVSERGLTVNHTADGQYSTANKYDEGGNLVEGSVATATEKGIVLRVYCDTIVGADVTESDATVPSLCFIATASYGHDSGEVGLLCNFRDKCLLTNPLGTAFVNAYYKLSPPLADFISESEPLKAAVRVALKPLVAIAINALDEEAAVQNAPWFIMFMLCGAGVTATLIRVDKRKKKRAKE